MDENAKASATRMIASFIMLTILISFGFGFLGANAGKGKAEEKIQQLENQIYMLDQKVKTLEAQIEADE